MLHLRVPNKGKGQGPRIAFLVEAGLVISEDVQDATITHVMIHGINYTVDSTFDETAAELGVPATEGGATA